MRGIGRYEAMPFVVEADFYGCLQLQLGGPPWPEESRAMEVEVAAFLNALPRAETERCWRHWYRRNVNAEEPVACVDTVEIDDGMVAEWERIIRAADRFAYFLQSRMDLMHHELPWVDLWLGFEEERTGERFKASAAGWGVGRPGLARYR